jgi:hypothetical protein
LCRWACAGAAACGVLALAVVDSTCGARKVRVRSVTMIEGHERKRVAARASGVAGGARLVRQQRLDALRLAGLLHLAGGVSVGGREREHARGRATRAQRRLPARKRHVCPRSRAAAAGRARVARAHLLLHVHRVRHGDRCGSCGRGSCAAAQNSASAGGSVRKGSVRMRALRRQTRRRLRRQAQAARAPGCSAMRRRPAAMQAARIRWQRRAARARAALGFGGSSKEPCGAGPPARPRVTAAAARQRAHLCTACLRPDGLSPRGADGGADGAAKNTAATRDRHFDHTLRTRVLLQAGAPTPRRLRLAARGTRAGAAPPPPL